MRLTSPLSYLAMQSRVRIVDNSEIGKQGMVYHRAPKIIRVLKGPQKGVVGDRVCLAIGGLVKRGVIVGQVLRQKAMQPKYDSNNVVLTDNKGNPLGTRILIPIPNALRNPKLGYHKLIAIATRFV